MLEKREVYSTFLEYETIEYATFLDHFVIREVYLLLLPQNKQVIHWNWYIKVSHKRKQNFSRLTEVSFVWKCPKFRQLPTKQAPGRSLIQYFQRLDHFKMIWTLHAPIRKSLEPVLKVLSIWKFSRFERADERGPKCFSKYSLPSTLQSCPPFLPLWRMW